MLLAVSSLLTKLIALVSTMIITRILDESAYGTYKQVFLAFNVALPFLSFGLTHGIFYYLPFEKERVRGRVNDCYFIYLVSGIAFSVFLLLGGNEILAARFDNPEVAPLMLLIIPYVISTLLFQCNNAIFNIMDRVKTYMIYATCSGLFTNIVLIITMLISPTAKSVVLAYVATNVISGIVIYFLTKSVLPKDDARIRPSSMLELIKFSLPIGIAGMVGNLSVQMDSLFVSAMRTTEEFAVYSVGAHEIILINVIVSSISSAVTPRMRLLISEGKNGECSELFQTAAKRMASMLVPMMCFFWVWSNDFISFVYSEKYLAAVWIFRIYLLYFLLRIAVTGPVFSSLGMGKYILARSIATCVLNAVLNYIGIKLFGTIGAAIATILSGWLIFIFSIAPMLKKKLDIPLHKTYPIKTVACSLAIGMGSAYAIKWLISSSLVPKLLQWLNLSSFLNEELAKTAEAALKLGINGVAFALVFVALALLFMKKDYNWITEKIGAILGKVFRKKARA